MSVYSVFVLVFCVCVGTTTSLYKGFLLQLSAAQHSVDAVLVANKALRATNQLQPVKVKPQAHCQVNSIVRQLGAKVAKPECLVS